jgi:hypothetical protein
MDTSYSSGATCAPVEEAFPLKMISLTHDAEYIPTDGEIQGRILGLSTQSRNVTLPSKVEMSPFGGVLKYLVLTCACR